MPIYHMLYILEGMQITLVLWGSVLLLSLPLSLIFVYISWISPKPVGRLIDIYTWIMRGSPLLLQVFFIYYGMSLIGITFDAITAGIIAFTLNYTAYFIVIFKDAFFKSGIDQVEAGLALGMKKNVIFAHVLLPQAIRQSIGVLSSEALNLVKDTAIVSTIGMADMLRNAKEIVIRDVTILPFFYAFILYLLFSGIIVLIFTYIEKHYAYESR
ncbi:MAG: amino acid ABC transporter permease [Culicoidibacterales bacterium]